LRAKEKGAETKTQISKLLIFSSTVTDCRLHHGNEFFSQTIPLHALGIQSLFRTSMGLYRPVRNSIELFVLGLI
jgi:hypothetical protein